MKEINRWEKKFPQKLRGAVPGIKRLYYIGALPDDGPSCAIVGARKCSIYGRNQAEALAAYLTDHGVAVISGMAVGIDAAAHEGALKRRGKTFAVLGCGADICYPRGNIGLYEAIRANGGILSEYAPGTPPYSQHFPARNRIISGLADVVVVVEARERSGSLITADFALEQGRTVLAYPGRVGDRTSDGTNALIAQGAGIVCSPETVLKELEDLYGSERIRHSLTETSEGRVSEGTLPVSREAAGLYEALGTECRSLEELTAVSENTLPGIRSLLSELILEGYAEEVSPGIYARVEMTLARGR